MTPHRVTPEDFAEQLRERAERMLKARQSLQAAQWERDRAARELWELINPPDGADAIAIVDSVLFRVSRANETYHCTAERIHAQA